MGSTLLGLGICLFLVVEALSHPLPMADPAVIPTSEGNQLENAISAAQFLQELFHQKGERREAREESRTSPVRFQHPTLSARLEPSLGSIEIGNGCQATGTRATRLATPALELTSLW
jgi:hypothetical protein